MKIDFLKEKHTLKSKVRHQGQKLSIQINNQRVKVLLVPYKILKEQLLEKLLKDFGKTNMYEEDMN